MGFFRRHSLSAPFGPSELDAINEFWSWWQPEGAARTASAIADGQPERMVAALSQQVHAIEPGLTWELGPGSGDSTHVLVISAEGNPALRGTARRWRRAAPAADSTWEYADCRPPAADPAVVILTLGNTRVDVASATAWAHVSGAEVDVAVYHPAFPGLAEPERQLATVLLLDAVLGESAVEIWVNGIETTLQPPIDPVPLTGLRAVVRELSDRFTDSEGEPAWVRLEGTTQDGDRVLAGTQIPLRSATAPHLDTHVAVRVPFTDRTPEGLADDGSLIPLRDFATHLSERLEGSGRLVAHETHGGARTLHLYVDSSTPAVEQLRPAIAGWDQGQVSLLVTPDPAWQFVQHLRA